MTSSFLTNAENSLASIDIDWTPSLVSFCWTSGICNAFPISVLSFSTIAGDVLAGAKMPSQNRYAEFGYPASSDVGTFGSAGERIGLLTTKGINLPSRIIESAGRTGE